MTRRCPYGYVLYFILPIIYIQITTWCMVAYLLIIDRNAWTSLFITYWYQKYTRTLAKEHDGIKEELLLLLNAGVQRIWPAAFIEIYGSYVTKLSSGSSSDLDLVVCFGDSNSCAYSNVISGSIEGSSQTSSSPFSQKIKDRDQGVSNLQGLWGITWYCCICSAELV